MGKNIGIVAFAFGVPDTIRSNWLLAQIASEKARGYGVPVYTQLDIRIQPGIEVEHTPEGSGSPPPTLRIARGAVKWAQRKGFRALWIVAAKPHIWRAQRDVERAVRESGAQIEVYVLREMEEYSENYWYCPDSTQERVRSREAWNKRERILNFMPFFIYKRVAS